MANEAFQNFYNQVQTAIINGGKVERKNGKYYIYNADGKSVEITKSLYDYGVYLSRQVQSKSIQNNDVASEATNKEAQTKKAATEGVQENEVEASNTESNETEKGGVVVTGDEFGEYADIKELRAKAKKYYKEKLQGTSVENPILGQVNLDDISVQFTRAGLGKMGTTSAKEHKLLLVAHLPELIRSATSITREDNVKNKRDASQYSYLHTEAIIDGKRQPVTITIFTDVNGNKYYNHILPGEEKAEKNKDLPVPSAQATGNSNGIPTIGKSSDGSNGHSQTTTEQRTSSESASLRPYGNSSLPQTEPTSKDKNSTKQDTTQQERSQNEDAFSNEQEEKAQATSTQETPDWGSEEEATTEFEKAFGVKRKSKNNDAPDKIESVNNAYFDSIAKDDDNFDDLVKELKSELSKISANPVFNPKVYELGLRIGNVLIRRGMRSFSAWSKAMVDTIGDTIKPWLNSIWRGITSLPKNKTFDERKIRAATQLVGTEYSKGNTSLEQITNSIRDKFGDEIYNSNKEYIKAAYNAVAGFYNSEADQKEVTHNEPNDRADTVAKRDGRRDNQNSVGESVQDERAGDNGGRSLQENREENEPRNSARVRTDSPAVSGKISDSRVQEEKSEDRADSPRSADLSGSIKDSYNGTTALDDGRKGKDIGTSENGRNNATAKVKSVKENNIPYKAGDLKSIQADLPSLMPEQMEDVVKAEKRLLLDHGKGMMFTNGTGTGKTFTGLGVVKRFVLAGKQNIIIVAPNDDILNEWVRSGKKYFNLDIHKLENTRTAGSGIIATTYANFGQNNTLVKREWDLVVTDESHKLMSSEKADDTAALNTMRALTRHVQGVERRLEMLFPKIAQRIQDILKKLRSNDISEQEENKLNDEVWELRKKLDPERKKLYDETNALKDEDKPKVLFLSATPFAYVKAVDYANGYLFDYEKADNSGYNSGDGYDRFFMEHFGYRMRYNKLTRPDASVNQDLMEREFNSWLKKTGALSGRTLKLDTDYDRGFLLVDGGVGAKIDAGMKIFEDDLRNEKSKYALLGTIVEGRLKGRFTRYILEAIKAKESVKLVQQYLDAGKKVVLFHDFNKNEARNPFELTMEDFNTLNMVDDTGNSARMALKEYELFQREHPELLNLDLSDLASPIEVIQKAFGDRARIFNGRVSKKDRTKAVKDFNDDDSSADVILCQRDAGKEGISLHDTTGKHQRVLIDLGLATKPTDTIQTEGRIRRTGAVSNAIIRYLNTGTNVERFAFATTIAGRASTAENLAMGEDARNLKQSIIDSFEESQNDDWQKYLPGSETEGTGGQAKDASDASKVSLYEKAKTFYYGRGKRTSKNKAREGKDYFATPEPIGLKMVEWLRLENGESALEPSAGHGAISRWFSETTKNTIIEPSGELSTQARMTLNGGTTSRVVSGTFEKFDLVNKFDGIAMNPPFGTGGKTAVDHIAKAFKHLRVGGRMVAILPEGASADKHFNKWFFGEEQDGEQVGGVENAHLVANIHLPTVTFERAGTKVATRIVVIDKLPKNYEGYLNSTEELDLRGITDINELFDELENMEMPRRKITARSQEMRNNDNAPTTSLHFTPGTFTRTDNGKVIPNAKINARVARDVYEKINNIAKKHGGRYEMRYSKSFLFERGGEEGRDAFIKEAEEVLNEAINKPNSFLEDVIALKEANEQLKNARAKDYSKEASELFSGVRQALSAELDKISSESPIENSDNVGDNRGKRRYSLSMSDKNLTKTNDDWTANHIHIGENGNRTIELLYKPFANEEVEERYRRRMMEVARIDPKYDKGVSKNPYVNFIGKSGRNAVEARFNRGQLLDEIVDDLTGKLQDVIETNGIQNEEVVIIKAMALKGGLEYAKEYAAQHGDARGNKQTSIRAISRREKNSFADIEGSSRRDNRDVNNRIRPTSRTEEGGFYNAQRSVEELKEEAKEAFPNATEIKETADGVILTMPNGMKMTVNIKGEITASAEEIADAKEAHNIASDIEVTIEGYEETVDGGAFIALSQGSRKGTGFHEAYHVAEELVFTDKEKKDAKRLISPNDEERANEFAKWKLDRKKGGNFVKLWRKIADFAARMASLAGYETKRGLFLKVESGEMYNRKGNVTRGNGGRRYSFAGEKSNTANLDTLNRAKEMEEEGNSRDEIFNETGWVKGKDNKWRYEIPDNLDKIDFTPLKKAGLNKSISLGDIYDNEELYKAYPELKNVSVVVRNNLPGAEAQVNFKIRGTLEKVLSKIGIGKKKPEFYNGKYEPIIEFDKSYLDDKTSRGTLIHEIQHIIQHIERFARGGTGELAKSLMGKDAENISDYDAWAKLGGEQEAEEVRTRAESRNRLKAFKEEEQKAEKTLERIIAKQPKEIQEMVAELNEIEEQNDRAMEIMNELPEEVTGAIYDYWYAESGTYFIEKTLSTPTIHTDDAIIIFDGKEFSASLKKPAESNSFSASVDNEAEQSVFEKAATKLAKKMGLKPDNVIVEAEKKDNNDMSMVNYLLRSPSRIKGTFELFFRMGKKAMDTLTKNRSDSLRKLDTALNTVKTDKEKQDLYDVLLCGDTEQKEFTKEELTKDYGENVANAYIGVRRLMTKAYRMLNDARRKPVIWTKRYTDKQLDELRDNKFVEIKSVGERETDGRRKVTYKEYQNYKREGLVVDKDTIDRFENDEDMQVISKHDNGDGTFTVSYREGMGNVNKLTGYIPHFFHNYMIRVKDAEGKTVMTLGSGKTEREAIKKAEEWLKNNKLSEGQQVYISPKTFNFEALGMDESQSAVVVGDKDYKKMMNSIAEGNDLTLDEAKDLLNGSVKMKNRHRFLGNLLQRKGVSGYETDLPWVLRHYLNSVARYHALETEFKPQAISLFERLFGDFGKEHKGLAQYVKDYIGDINGNPSAVEEVLNKALRNNALFKYFITPYFGDRAALQLSNTLTNWTSMLCLGYLNTSSALLNLSQCINVAGYLGSPTYAAKVIAAGFKRKYGLKEQKILLETNVANDIGLDSGSGYDINRGYAGKALGAIGKISQKGMILFKTTEQAMRRGAVLVAYEKAIKEGKNHKQAIAYAKEINDKSNFDYGIADAPNVFRRGSIFSQLLLQFKKYGFKELEVMADMCTNATGSKQKLTFWGMYFLLCGLLQVPALDWLDKLLGENMKTFVQKSIMEVCGDSEIGKALGKTAMYGVLSNIGVDVSARAGMADVIPTDLKSMLQGPTISRAGGIMEEGGNLAMSLVSDSANGSVASFIRALSPGMYNIYSAATGEKVGRRDRVTSYYEGAWERILRAAGFQSTDERISSDMERIVTKERSGLTKEKQEAVDAYIANPTPANLKRIKELGISAKTVKEERKRKKQDRAGRLKEKMTDAEQKRYNQMMKFAE